MRTKAKCCCPVHSALPRATCAGIHGSKALGLTAIWANGAWHPHYTSLSALLTESLRSERQAQPLPNRPPIPATSAHTKGQRRPLGSPRPPPPAPAALAAHSPAVPNARRCRAVAVMVTVTPGSPTALCGRNPVPRTRPDTPRPPCPTPCRPAAAPPHAAPRTGEARGRPCRCASAGTSIGTSRGFHGERGGKRSRTELKTGRGEGGRQGRTQRRNRGLHGAKDRRGTAPPPAAPGPPAVPAQAPSRGPRSPQPRPAPPRGSPTPHPLSAPRAAPPPPRAHRLGAAAPRRRRPPPPSLPPTALLRIAVLPIPAAPPRAARTPRWERRRPRSSRPTSSQPTLWRRSAAAPDYNSQEPPRATSGATPARRAGSSAAVPGCETPRSLSPPAPSSDFSSPVGGARGRRRGRGAVSMATAAACGLRVL